jgi:hypothetical protein
VEQDWANLDGIGLAHWGETQLLTGKTEFETLPGVTTKRETLA